LKVRKILRAIIHLNTVKLLGLTTARFNFCYRKQ